MPATVQAILAARIDRLPSDEKRLLQSASVIGKDVPVALLRSIAELPEDQLQRGLAHLQTGEFLYEMNLFPEMEYTFKHALTHEVAYASLLQERRRVLHARMVEVIEQLYPGRLAEHVERLALHASRGELWPKAVGYGRDAGAKALARSAHPEAVASFEQALEALGHLPESREVVEQSIDLRFNLRNSLWPLGELTRLIKHLGEAEALAGSLGDERRLGQLAAYMSQFFAWMGDHDKAIASGRQARTIAEGLGDFALRVASNFRLGQAYYALGEYRLGIDVLRSNVDELTGRGSPACRRGHDHRRGRRASVRPRRRVVRPRRRRAAARRRGRRHRGARASARAVSGRPRPVLVPAHRRVAGVGLRIDGTAGRRPPAPRAGRRSARRDRPGRRPLPLRHAAGRGRTQGGSARRGGCARRARAGARAEFP